MSIEHWAFGISIYACYTRRMGDLELAKELFQANSYTFVIVRDAQVIATGTRDGVGELLEAVAQFGELLQGAALADKVVGKAVALIAVHAGIAKIYTPLGSQAAQNVLREYGVLFETERLVPLIRNKRNDGACPLEQLTMPLNEPLAAVNALRAFVAERKMLAR